MPVIRKHNRQCKEDAKVNKKRKFDTQGESEEVARDLGNRKRFHPRDLRPLQPMNDNQEKYLDALYSEIPIVMGLGFAGTGKSYLALHSALHQVFDDSTPYEKVYIVRNIVESGQAMGFLPGEISQKIEPYEAPYKSMTKEMMQFNSPYDHLKALDYVEFMPPNFIRGTTLEGIIILEEAQNMDYGTIRDIISRAGPHTKVVVNGDVRQDDLARLRKQSGLSQLIKVTNQMPYGSVCKVDFQLEDIVRSGLVRDFLIADYDYEMSNQTT